MKFMFMCFLFLFIFITETFTQTTRDTIQVTRSFWGNSYHLGSNEMTKSQIADFLSENDRTIELISSYRTYKTIGNICTYGGLAYIAVLLLKTEHEINNYGKRAQLPYFQYALGLGMELVGIGSLIHSNKLFNRAINTYNKPIDHTEITDKNSLHIYCGLNGIGIQYRF